MKEGRKRRIEKRQLRIALRYVLHEGVKHNTRVVEKKGNIVTLQIFEKEYMIDPTGLITFFLSPIKEIGNTYKIDISKLYFTEVIPHGFGPKPKSKRQRKRRREEARRDLEWDLNFKRSNFLN